MRLGKILAFSVPGSFATLALVACGSRGPLEDGTGGVENLIQGNDGGLLEDASADGGNDSGAEADGGCAATLAACHDNNTCNQILTCVTTTCGGPTQATRSRAPPPARRATSPSSFS